jgi:hypothetical protein
VRNQTACHPQLSRPSSGDRATTLPAIHDETGIGEDYTVEAGLGQGGSPQIVVSGSFSAPSSSGTYAFDLANVLVNVLSAVSPTPVPPAPWPVEQATVDTTGAGFSFVVADLLGGDLNCDGVVNGDDVPHFVQALVDPAGYDAEHDGDPYAACARSRAGLNLDGRKDGLDIELFLNLLLGS